MKKVQAKLFVTYLLILVFILAFNGAFAQINAVVFNAGWNDSNDVDWFNNLNDCDKQKLLIEDNGNQQEYSIAIVPTIIIFDDGEEVKRFQADLSFKMVATKKEVQGFIDELIISKF